MNNWQQHILGNVADIKLSNVDKITNKNEKVVKLCNYTDVYRNSFINKEKAQGFMTATCDENEFKKFILRKGQVAITKDSETTDDIGVSTYIKEDFEDVILGYHLSLITPDEEKLDGKFLHYWLNTKQAKRYFENNAGGSGQRCTLTLDCIKSIPLYLPDNATQIYIGKILFDLDSKIELNNRINAILEAMAKTIYDYWFIQFDFPDKNGKPYKSSGGKMVWNEKLKREVPFDWDLRTIGEYANLSNGKGINKKLLYKTGEYPVYGSNGITGYTNEFLFNEAVIAIGRVGVNYGEVHYSLDPCWITDNAVTAQPKKGIYLWWLINTFRRIQFKAIAGGSAQPLITQGKLKELKFAVPNNNLFKMFDDKVNSIYLQLNLNIKQNQQLRDVRDWLLPMLMNGQVKVR